METTIKHDVGFPHSNTTSTETPVPPLPAPPTPSADLGIIPTPVATVTNEYVLPNAADIDIFVLLPELAMKMLCNTMETLVQITGDVPPTPPVSQPSTPISRVIALEGDDGSSDRRDNGRPRSRQVTEHLEEVDAVPPRAKTPIGSPESGPSEPMHIIGPNMVPLHEQHGAISRKFYSKKPPPIALDEYLSRLHRYCPMSTGVYLATSLYIYRLAILERKISVTPRNAHRLLLAGLRIAMKALEDLSYPHHRFAKVGGVGETELARLEVSFCFLTGFDLKVDEKMLLQHAETIRQGVFLHVFPSGLQLTPPIFKNKGH